MNSYFREQYARHVLQYAKIKRDKRYWNIWYRGKVSQVHQFKQLKEKEDWKTYLWLKDHWRKELEGYCRHRG